MPAHNHQHPTPIFPAGAGHAVAAARAPEILAHAARAALMDAVRRREAPETQVEGGEGEEGEGESSSDDDWSSGSDGEGALLPPLRGRGAAARAAVATAAVVAQARAEVIDIMQAGEGRAWVEWTGMVSGGGGRAGGDAWAAASGRQLAGWPYLTLLNPPQPPRQPHLILHNHPATPSPQSTAAMCGHSLALDCAVVAGGLLSVLAAAAPPAWVGAGAEHEDAAKAALARATLALLDSLGWEFQDVRRVELWAARAACRALAPSGDRFRDYGRALAVLRQREGKARMRFRGVGGWWGAANAGAGLWGVQAGLHASTASPNPLPDLSKPSFPFLPPPPPPPARQTSTTADPADPLAVIAASAAALVRVFRTPGPLRDRALQLGAGEYELAACAVRAPPRPPSADGSGARPAPHRVAHAGSRRRVPATPAPAPRRPSADARCLAGCARYGCVRLDGPSEAGLLAPGLHGSCSCPACGAAHYCSPACRYAAETGHAAACTVATRVAGGSGRHTGTGNAWSRRR